MIQGIFASHGGIVGDRVGDFASVMLRINPQGNAPLLALSSGMPKEVAADTVFNWFEEAHQSYRVAIAANANSGATTIVVGDGSSIVPNQVMLVEQTGEVVFVSAVAGASLTVIRGIGGTTPANVTTAMFLQQVGNAQPEGSGMPTPVSSNGINRINYVQIFRNAWGVTGSAEAVKFRTGDKVAKNKRECADFHAEDMERAMLWGVPHIMSLNQKPFRMSAGVLHQIRTRGGIVETALSGGTAGDLSFIDFENFLRRVFEKNIRGQPNERLVFGGSVALSAFNQMARLDGTYEITVNETALGIKIFTIVTQFGTVKIMTHPLMVESPFFTKELYVLHPGAIKRRVLRETFKEDYDSDGRRINGIDASQGVITTECGFQVGAPQVMGIYTNIAKGRKSGT